MRLRMIGLVKRSQNNPAIMKNVLSKYRVLPYLTYLPILSLLILLLGAAPVLGAPAIESIDPEYVFNNEPVTVTITGTGFEPQATVQLVSGDGVALKPTAVTVADSTTITCTFDPSGAAADDYDVVVANPNGESYVLSGGFIIDEAAAPVISRVEPRQAPGDRAAVTLIIRGKDFNPEATVQLINSDETSIAPTEIAVTGSTTITCTFDLSGAAAGAYDVVVANPNGESDTFSEGFTIQDK